MSTSTMKPRGHTRFVAMLCDLKRSPPSDRAAPRVTRFRVEMATTTPWAVTVHWSATDDQALWRVELWRAPDRQGRPHKSRWRLVGGGVRSLTGTSARGELTDTPPPGRWWYGVHVLDRARNVGYEPAPVAIVSPER